MKTIGFPGLGWEFNIDSTAFTIFGLDIQWYGIILSTGIVLAFLLFYRLATKKEQIPGDSVYTATLFLVPIAIIGARTVYVLTRWDEYKGRGFLDIINIRQGGIAIYGAIIFGLATVLVYNKIKKTSSLRMLDALAPAVMLGQIVGRWGNFVNGEAYGWTANVESFPWAMWLEKVKVDDKVIEGHLVHPTFLYESLWNLIGLVLILAVLYRKKKYNGQIFCAYMGWYGFGRFFIEMIRADSLYIIGNLKFSVFTGAVCFLAAIICAVIFRKRKKEEDEELAEYKSSFAALKLKQEAEADALAGSVFDTAGEAAEGETTFDDPEDGINVDEAEEEEITLIEADGIADPDDDAGDPDAEQDNEGNGAMADEKAEGGETGQ